MFNCIGVSHSRGHFSAIVTAHNLGRALRVIPRGEQRLTVYRAHQVCHKNEDISESVSSFDTGAIFRPRSGHVLSRNVSVVSGYAFYKNSNWRKGFLHDSEIDKIFEKVPSGEL